MHGKEEGVNFASRFPSANLEGKKEKSKTQNKACVWETKTQRTLK